MFKIVLKADTVDIAIAPKASIMVAQLPQKGFLAILSLLLSPMLSKPTKGDCDIEEASPLEPCGLGDGWIDVLDLLETDVVL